MQKFVSAQSPILQALEGEGNAKPSRRRDEKVERVGFCAEGRVAASAILVRVKGVGELGRPIEPDTAQVLKNASVPARYGRREATLLDKRVRDTGMIGADLLSVSWADGALGALMSEVAQALSLPHVQARLHNLLVYGPGQFFKTHQDTEKHRGMVATLVLVWPSAHLGGELRVRHGKEEACFASQHLRLDGFRWFAFYADCQHEVCPVTEGWRVVLTYDLVVPVGLSAPAAPASAPLLKAMREHFFPGEDIHTWPWVFLLDHKYTQHGLRWSLLKGEDRSRVAALRAAAEALDLSAHLALVEISQQWTATEDYSSRGRRAGNPMPEDLIDESIAVDYLVGTDDRPLRHAALHVRRADVHSFTDTDESFLVDEEYEGYMGNYGETLEYWYRRAALVLQTPLAAEAELVAALRMDPERTKKHLIDLLRHVRNHPVLYPLLSLRPLIEALPTDADAPTEAIALSAAVVDALEQALARPEPLPDDFGLRDIEWVCRCADCRLVIDWASSSSAQPLILAMAESRRSHLITKLQAADAPFGFDVVRKGSPHKLVISKPVDLHRRYATRRKTWAEGLNVLASRIRPASCGAKNRR